MKGIILCGGSGSRLFPLTKILNKCILPIYNKPLIYHVIETFVASGINDILLVCGGNQAAQIFELLGNGEDFGLRHLHYTYQRKPLGIAHALGLAKEFASNEPVALMLSDNLFEDTFEEEIRSFESNPVGAKIFLSEVQNPSAYGCVDVAKDGSVVRIVEKPENPTSNFIATGLYLYDSTVWEKLDGLEPSERGELEITDLNNMYLYEKKLSAHRLDGFWCDIGNNFSGYLNGCVKMMIKENTN